MTLTSSTRALPAQWESEVGTVAATLPTSSLVNHQGGALALSTPTTVPTQTYQSRWGAERSIDPALLVLNTTLWSGILALDTPDGQRALFDLLDWLETFKPHALGSHGRSQYITTGAQRLADKYQSEGLFIEGINPETGELSGDRQLRLEQSPAVKGFGANAQPLPGPKYLRPPGGTAQVFFARVTPEICQQIAQRHHLPDIPTPDTFWPWVKDHRLPLVLVEGAGDALASLSRGIIAIGAPGHHMCFEPGTLDLKPELLWILADAPEVVIAFDQDQKPKTIQAVNRSRIKVAKALRKLGCGVRVATWSSKEGKGFGDLPEQAAFQALLMAQPFKVWQRLICRQQGEALVKSYILQPFTRPYDLVITSAEELTQVLELHPYVFIDGPTGSGKTEGFIPLIHTLDTYNHYHFSPTRSLARNAASTLGLAYLNEAHFKGADDAVALVINSVLKLQKPVYPSTCLYLDEVEQLLTSLIHGSINQENRQAKVEKLAQLLQFSDRVYAASATANQKELDYLEAVTGQPYLLVYYDPQLHAKGKLTIHTGSNTPGSSRGALGAVQRLALQPRTYVATDSIKETMNLQIALEQQQEGEAGEGNPLSVTGDLNPHIPLVVNQTTTQDDPLVQQLLSSPDPGQWLLDNWRGQSLISSPSLQSGFSIKNPDGAQLFDQVIGIAKGKSVSPATFVQMLGRYRCSVERIAFCPRHSSPPTLLTATFGKDKHQAWEQNSQEYALLLEQYCQSWADFDFAWGPEAIYLRELQLQQELEYRYFAAAVAAYGERDGYQVSLVTPDPAEVIHHTAEVQRRLAAPIASAEPIDPDTYKTLCQIPEPTRQQQAQIEAHSLRLYYGLAWNDPLTVEQVMEENFGQGRKVLAMAQRLVWDGKAIADDLLRQEKLGKGGFIWDATNHEATLEIWEKLGIEDCLAFCLENEYSYKSPQIQALAQTLAHYHDQLQRMPRLLGIKLTVYDPNLPDPELAYAKQIVKWVGQVLKHKLGIHTKSTRRREGNTTYRSYTIHKADLTALQHRLQQTAPAFLAKRYTPRSTALVKVLYPLVDLPSPDAKILGTEPEKTTVETPIEGKGESPPS